MLQQNPFKVDAISVTVQSGKKEYVPASIIERVIAECPTVEWKLLFCFARYVGCRVPSEIQNLTWDDINWKKSHIRLLSPKTERKGKAQRLVPIFPRVAKMLREKMAEGDGGKYVFTRLRHQTNPGVLGKRIVEKAGVNPWPKFFNSLRASCETDLVDQYGIRRACQWIGNSVKVAEKNYLLVKGTDFIEAGNGASDDFSEMTRTDAKNSADECWSVRVSRRQNKKSLGKRRYSGARVGGIGLEPTTSTMSTWRSSQLS